MGEGGHTVDAELRKGARRQSDNRRAAAINPRRTAVILTKEESGGEERPGKPSHIEPEATARNHTTAKSPALCAGHRIHLEATGGFEPPIRVLQTPALPLGYVALSFPEGWCRGGDLNPYALTGTAPSRRRVYLFHHLGR